MISNTIKAMAGLAGLSRQQIADSLGLARPQAVTNKLGRDSWTAQDVNKIAALAGYKLAFVDDAGRAVLTFPAPEQPGQPGQPAQAQDKQ